MDNFTGYKCKRNGAIAERVGWVTFNNFQVADNILAGIEFGYTKDTADGLHQGGGIKDALIVGRTANADDKLTVQSAPRGIITAKTENMTIDGVKFYNFDWTNYRGD